LANEDGKEEKAMTVIVTKRCLLIPPTVYATDIKQQVVWLNDPEVVKYSEQRHRRHDYASQHKYIESFHPPSMLRLITASNQLIGSITAHVDEHNSVADMGILIGDKSKWGQGYGTEAWEALMEHLFGAGIRKITAGCMSPNLGMVSICEKTKMHLEGYRRSQFILDDYPVCMDLWAKFNDGVH
jgi:RimJ/RimL family protein N-acetyltransferase